MRGITILLHRGFAHRMNEDGTFDSICLACFMTIATVGAEAQLQAPEDAHDCATLAQQKGQRREAPQFLKRAS